MVKFIDVDPNSISNLQEGRRGRVSYPILKSFMETGKTLAQLDRTGMQQNFQALYSSLNAYIRNHNLPVKLFSRGGQIFLMRTDVEQKGGAKPAVTGTDGRIQKPAITGRPPQPITPAVVKARAAVTDPTK